MSVRAAIVVTGTEVLDGRVRDRNGPWLADRLRELGVDLAYLTIVGDRPQDMRRALEFAATQRIDLVLTSGGLGPTADDLTTEIVARFQDRERTVDEALAERIETIVRPLLTRWPNIDPEAIRVGTRKQALVPRGATVLEPVGTAPGLVVPPSTPSGGPTVVVLPGPPRELQPMWSAAIATPALRAVLASATVYEQRTLRLFGIPESEIAETLRQAEAQGIELSRLEVTTCLKRGEIEVVTRYEPDAAGVYEQFEQLISERHHDTLFSTDGDTVDVQVAKLLRERRWTIAAAESCTGGELTARLTGPAGASEYVKGGVVVYSNDAKTALAGVDPRLIEDHGAVSEQVARVLAQGVRARMDVEVGIGVTGVAGPGGGTEQKPVGLVWLSVAGPHGSITRSVNLPGGRADIRDRTTTVALHIVRRLLLGEPDV
ncbi:MAG TPA: competence/damage-inducible protein A [Solirubrobacteraceae bacterium]|jgi:nicotinamide-nucleotide amidase